jgi:hypothetical protein
MNAELKRIVDESQAANACAPGLNEIMKFDTLEQVLASEHGPLLAALYAIKVKKARWPEAEGVIQKSVYAWSAYRTAFGIN